MPTELQMSEPPTNAHGISSRPDLCPAKCDECGAKGYVSQGYFEFGGDDPLLCPDCNE